MGDVLEGGSESAVRRHEKALEPKSMAGSSVRTQNELSTSANRTDSLTGPARGRCLAATDERNER